MFFFVIVLCGALNTHNNLAQQVPTQLFVISIDQKRGYIDCRGEIRIPPRFVQAASRFSEGMALAAMEPGRLGFINGLGEFVITPRYEDARNFHEGLAAVRLGGKWGFIDRSGLWVIEPRFDAARDFCNGAARVGLETVVGNIVSQVTDREREYDWKLIDREGDELGVGYSSCSPASTECVRWVFDAGMWGVKTMRDDWLIVPFADDRLPFQEGLASVKLDGKWGAINLRGELVIPLRYNWLSGFEDGLASFVSNDFEGYVNRDGDVIWSTSTKPELTP